MKCLLSGPLQEKFANPVLHQTLPEAELETRIWGHMIYQGNAATGGTRKGAEGAGQRGRRPSQGVTSSKVLASA